MRICSLVPGATEVIAALGVSDHLVGISHECDFPPSIQHVPVMIEPLVDTHLTKSEEIDRRVKELVVAGSPLYRLNEGAFHQAQPDLILTQDLCHVCSVTPDQLTRAIDALGHRPEVLTLSPTTLEDMRRDIVRIATAVGRAANGEIFVDQLRRRLEQVAARTNATPLRPRVVCLEWLGPLYVAGHWVPEMVEIAGGQNVLGSKETPSRETTWKDVEGVQPDIIFVMPCGYSIERTLNELGQPGPIRDEWQQACERWPNIYVVDAASYVSRPGPRLIDGVELLAALLHPDSHHPIDPLKAVRLEVSNRAGASAS